MAGWNGDGGVGSEGATNSTTTMQRRKFVIGLGSLAAGGAAATGTGAFTSVEAERTVKVGVADDADALLALKPDEGPNGDYAQKTQDDALRLIFSNNGNDIEGGGAGINEQAEFRADRVFTVTNQGTQDVWVWFDDDDSSDHDVVGYPKDTDGLFANTGQETVENFDMWFYHFSRRSPEYALDASAGILNLGPGDSSRIGVAVNTSDMKHQNYNISVDILADKDRPSQKHNHVDRTGF